MLARGPGWSVADIVCTSGPDDRPFEEQHSSHAIALVVAGSFQYRSSIGHAILTPGAAMLCRSGVCYECGHEHNEGDRCVSFWYAPEFFAQLIEQSRGRSGVRGFERPHLPPSRETARLAALAASGASGTPVPWHEIALGLALVAFEAASTSRTSMKSLPPNATAQVTRAVRRIEQHPDDSLTLDELARDAGLSPFHFLRTFEQLTGVTPHQYVLRTRLREAALRLSERSGRITDLAFDVGFGDVSNFNHAFRAEFGESPRAYRGSLEVKK